MAFAVGDLLHFVCSFSRVLEKAMNLGPHSLNSCPIKKTITNSDRGVVGVDIKHMGTSTEDGPIDPDAWRGDSGPLLSPLYEVVRAVRSRAFRKVIVVPVLLYLTSSFTFRYMRLLDLSTATNSKSLQLMNYHSSRTCAEC